MFRSHTLRACFDRWNIKISKKVRNRKVKSSELAAQYGSPEFNQRFFMRLLKVTEFLESRDWAEAVIRKQCAILGKGACLHLECMYSNGELEKLTTEQQEYVSDAMFFCFSQIFTSV